MVEPGPTSGRAYLRGFWTSELRRESLETKVPSSLNATTTCLRLFGLGVCSGLQGSDRGRLFGKLRSSVNACRAALHFSVPYAPQKCKNI